MYSPDHIERWPCFLDRMHAMRHPASTIFARSAAHESALPELCLPRSPMTADMLVAVGGFAVCLSKFGSIFMEIEAERNVNAFVARGVSEGMIEFAPRPHPAYRPCLCIDLALPTLPCLTLCDLVRSRGQ